MSSAHKSVRVRFAPSPTGFLHVGSIRSGLFEWLWARHSDGVFVLRIEDTDRERLVEGAIDQINESLEALGITPDEGPRQGGKYGPYVQSERIEIYRDHAKKLLETGALYRCWCSPERLNTLRENARAAGTAFKYDRHCLSHPKSPDEPHVLRFRVPEEPKTVAWTDAVRGLLSVTIDTIDDFVAVKSDGFPTYHFANVVDDHQMAITHVLRADEWLPSTPKHLLLFLSSGWDAPTYAHLPAVQGPTGGKKLSKREGAQSVQDYLVEGYLPEALMAFLATLGWNDGTTQEIFTPQELIKKFTLERIQHSPARFDKYRLTWINGMLIRQMPLDKLLAASEDFWPAGAHETSTEYRTAVLGLVQDRVKFLAELAELTDFFFIDPMLPNDFSAHELIKHIQPLSKLLADTKWTEEALETTIREYVEANELKAGKLFGALRVAITGRTAAPGLFETMAVLGQETTLRRLAAATKSL